MQNGEADMRLDFASHTSEVHQRLNKILLEIETNLILKMGMVLPHLQVKD